MVSGARVIQQMPQQPPPMPMMAPRVLPRPAPSQAQQMGLPPPGYGSAGEQIMMVLNGQQAGPYPPQYAVRGNTGAQAGSHQPIPPQQQPQQPQSSQQQESREFSISDSDFPALPGQRGAQNSGGSSNANASASVASAASNQQQQQQQQPPQQQPSVAPAAHVQYGRMAYAQQAAAAQQQQAAAAAAAAAAAQQVPPVSQVQQGQPQAQNRLRSGSREDTQQYGLLGLLGMIRVSDRDWNMLALGTDLTTLGLNLSSNEPLYATFSSPFSETPQSKDPFHLPESYSVPNLTPPAHMLSLVSDETLLYAFYTTPRDALQLNCARELYKRGWRYHKELQRWLLKIGGSEMRVSTPAYDRGPYFIYDPSTWEKVRNDNFLVVYEKIEGEPKPAQ